jgi:hypothetical protein
MAQGEAVTPTRLTGDELCDVDGCPKAEDHFPIAQLVLPMEMCLAVEVMQGIERACRRQGLEAVVVDLPNHGNGRLYASTKEHP